MSSGASLPREATKRKTLLENHPNDWKSHHRLEVEDEKLELRNVNGWAEYRQNPLTDADKRERLSSKLIGFTTRTKEERRAIGLLFPCFEPSPAVLKYLTRQPKHHTLPGATL